MAETMVDIKALRKSLEAKIEEIRVQLRALDVVEKIPQSSVPAISSPPETDAIRNMSGYLLSLATTEWQPLDTVIDLVRKKSPDTPRQQIITGYRRWEERGQVEMRGSRSEGFHVRRKPMEKATP